MAPQNKRTQTLPVLRFDGPPKVCGEDYGERERESILGFLSSQIVPGPEKSDFAAHCWLRLQDEFPAIAQFCEGLARGADISISQVSLLLLHEELIHAEHCSIIGVSKEFSELGQSFIAQNWDWPATVYCWPKVLRMQVGSQPATLTYSFPGLWACAGINESGLAIGWSGAGYWPAVPPEVGVPTYALIAGLLTLPNVSTALKVLERCNHAGSFILFLTDAAGELAVVEAWPRRLAIQRNEKLALRTNHYLNPQAIEATNQANPFCVPGATTAQRFESLRAIVPHDSQLGVEAAQTALCHPNIRAAYKLEDAYGGYTSMTIDSMCLEPAKREISIARGLPERHAFVRYSLDPRKG